MVDEYIRFKTVQNASERTISEYKKHLGYFIGYLNKTSIWAKYDVTTIYDVTHIYGFAESLSCSVITKNSYLRSIRAFTYWCQSKGYLPNFKIQLLKEDEPERVVYSDKDIALLLKRPDKKASFTEYKTWVFINFMLGTGCRVGSALEIKWEDIQDGYVILRKTKTRQRLVIPLCNTLESILSEYRHKVEKFSPEYIFCSVYGSHGVISSYQDNVSAYNRKRGVSITSIHAFRRTFATNYIRNGGDPLTLQRLLGHSTLAMTNEYVKLSGVDLKDAMREYDPLAGYNRKKIGL